jgi:hypothetical protein
MWTRLWVTGTAITATTGYLSVITATTTAVGQLLYVDDVLIEQSSILQDYFDGSTPVKVRRNRVTNPNFGYGGLAGWSGYWGPSVTVTTANPYPGGNGFSALVKKTTDTHTQQGIIYGQQKDWYKDGDIIHGIMRVRGEVGVQMDIGFKINAGGAYSGPVDVIGDGQWHEYDFTMVKDPSHTEGIGLQINVDNSGVWPEQTPMFQVDSALLANETSGAYFDADFPIAPYAGGWEGSAGSSINYLKDPDFTYAWTGTANASASIQTGVGVAGHGITPGVLATIQSSHWVVAGTKSMRMIPLSSAIGAGFATIRTFTVDDAGKTFTLVAEGRLTEPFVSSNAAYMRSIFITSTPGNQTGPQLPNSAGAYRLRFTFTLGPTTVAGTVRLYHGGAVVDPPVWWDNVVLVEGTQTPEEYYTSLGYTSTDLEMLYLKTKKGATGPSLEDMREQVYGSNAHAYFAALSGLTPAQNFMLPDHQYAYYKAQSGASGTLADVSRAFWIGAV